MIRFSSTSKLQRKRIVWLLFFILVIQIIIIVRFAYVQIIWSPKLKKLAEDQWANSALIPARRGNIYDRNMNPLAISGNAIRVDVFPKSIYKLQDAKKMTADYISEKLALALQVKKTTILSKMNEKTNKGEFKNTINIAKDLNSKIGDKIKSLDLPGVLVSNSPKRIYPNGKYLAQVLGSLNADNNGQSGLELKYNKQLVGIPGRYLGEKDRFNKELPYGISNYINPSNGDNLILTIDQSIQFFTEKILEDAVKKYKAKSISAMVMDPKSGEILAMASKPDFNPNNPMTNNTHSSMNLWKNSNVNRNFEMGSVIKVITAAAALEENVVHPSDRFMCKGYKNVSGTILHCAKRSGHGLQTFQQILENSCNVGFIEIGRRLGKYNLYKYFNAFGLTQKTGIDLPGEEKGILLPIHKVGPVELATESFGQNISITSIQYITAFSAIANDGTMVQPHIVKTIMHMDRNRESFVKKEIAARGIKSVVSANTAKKLRVMLEAEVTTGGGKNAYIPGYNIGGKTGTAQIPRTNGPGYEKDKYNSSFICMFPSNNPKYVVLTSIEEPDKSNYYAGNTAAPVAKSIVLNIINYFHLQPQ